MRRSVSIESEMFCNESFDGRDFWCKYLDGAGRPKTLSSATLEGLREKEMKRGVNVDLIRNYSAVVHPSGISENIKHDFMRSMNVLNSTGNRDFILECLRKSDAALSW